MICMYVSGSPPQCGKLVCSWRCSGKRWKLTLLRGADMIDKATKEIKQDDDKTVYKSLEEIGDDLPDHSPRFVLLSYPMTLVRNPSMISFWVDMMRLTFSSTPALWTAVCPLRVAVLPPRHLQQRAPHALRRRQGVVPEHGRGQQGDRPQLNRRFGGDSREARCRLSRDSVFMDILEQGRSEDRLKPVMLEEGMVKTRHMPTISPGTLLEGQNMRVAQSVGVSRGYFLTKV